MHSPNVVVTGASGFLGRHLVPVLEARYGSAYVTALSSSDYDLIDAAQVDLMFNERKPDVLIHLAAYVGGIGATSERPAKFFHRNILLTSLTFEAAARHRIRKLIYPMNGCVYPANATSPIGEDQIGQGSPQGESAAYSTAKMTGIVAAEAYRKEFGLNSAVLIPGNMYGEFDNFRVKESCVVPALIRRFGDAKITGARQVVCWGTGLPSRDFVYAGDVAQVVPYFIENDVAGPVNISSGVRTSISELAGIIKELMAFPGEVAWDAGKPDGPMDRTFDVARMKELGLRCPTSLRAGLERTIEWFEKNAPSQADGLRM